MRGQSSVTCDDLAHPLHRVHHDAPFCLGHHRGPFAAQDLTVWDQANHELVSQSPCLRAL